MAGYHPMPNIQRHHFQVSDVLQTDLSARLQAMNGFTHPGGTNFLANVLNLCKMENPDSGRHRFSHRQFR
jgi:hypothetical protein